MALDKTTGTPYNPPKRRRKPATAIPQPLAASASPRKRRRKRKPVYEDEPGWTDGSTEPDILEYLRNPYGWRANELDLPHGMFFNPLVSLDSGQISDMRPITGIQGFRTARLSPLDILLRAMNAA